MLGQQDVATAADVARKNITLNSLLALAQMSKPQIVGGTTSYATGTGATRPDVAFSGQVPVGGIAQAGWDYIGEPLLGSALGSIGKSVSSGLSGVGVWLGGLFD